MISIEQIKVYIKLDGNIDRYQRLERKFKAHERFVDDEWSVLDELYQRLVIRENNRESESYAKQTDTLLIENFPNENVRELFRNYCLGIKETGPWWKIW